MSESELRHAYEMGKDSVINGANEKNCNFRIFSNVEGMRAWEKAYAKSGRSKE